MLRVVVICFFVISTHLFSSVDFDFEGYQSMEDNKVIVSLGSGCDTGLTLRDCGLRNAAYPFDWVISKNHERLITLFDEDFEHYTDENCIIPVYQVLDHPNPLMNTCYDIFFVHEGSVLYDWSDTVKYQEQLDRIKAKYERRVNRFRELNHFSGKVFFVRNFVSEGTEQVNHHREMALELREALRRYFPDLDFTLVIVTYTDVNALPIGELEGVVEFRMNRSIWMKEYADMYRLLLAENAP